jgi:hypothetical protein
MVVKHGPFQIYKSLKIFESILRKIYSSVQEEGIWWRDVIMNYTIFLKIQTAVLMKAARMK